MLVALVQTVLNVEFQHTSVQVPHYMHRVAWACLSQKHSHFQCECSNPHLCQILMVIVHKMCFTSMFYNKKLPDANSSNRLLEKRILMSLPKKLASEGT